MRTATAARVQIEQFCWMLPRIFCVWVWYLLLLRPLPVIGWAGSLSSNWPITGSGPSKSRYQTQTQNILGSIQQNCSIWTRAAVAVCWRDGFKMWNQDTNIHDSWLPNLNPLSPWNNFRLLRNMNDGVKWSWLIIMSNPAKNAGWKVPEFVASADVTTKRLTINQQQLQTVHKMYY